MKPSTLKAVVGIGAVALVGVAYFVFGCDQGDLYPLLAAIVVLGGKELAEYRFLRNGGR